MNAWTYYVQRLTKGLTQTETAAKTGIAQTNIGRWLRGEPGAPKAESVVALARAFGEPPIEALLAAGYITAEEAGAAIEIRTPISEYSAVEHLDELRRKWLSKAD